MAGVVAACGHQAHPDAYILKRTRLPLLLAGDLEVLRAGVNGQPDVLAVPRADRDDIAVDALDFSDEVRAPDPDALGIEFAVALFVPNSDVAVDLDLGPAGLRVAALDHHGGVSPKKGLASCLRVLDRQLLFIDRGHCAAKDVFR